MIKVQRFLTWIVGVDSKAILTGVLVIVEFHLNPHTRRFSAGILGPYEEVFIFLIRRILNYCCSILFFNGLLFQSLIYRFISCCKTFFVGELLLQLLYSKIINEVFQVQQTKVRDHTQAYGLSCEGCCQKEHLEVKDKLWFLQELRLRLVEYVVILFSYQGLESFGEFIELSLLILVSQDLFQLLSAVIIGFNSLLTEMLFWYFDRALIVEFLALMSSDWDGVYEALSDKGLGVCIRVFVQLDSEINVESADGNSFRKTMTYFLLLQEEPETIIDDLFVTSLLQIGGDTR